MADIYEFIDQEGSLKMINRDGRALEVWREERVVGLVVGGRQVGGDIMGCDRGYRPLQSAGRSKGRWACSDETVPLGC